MKNRKRPTRPELLICALSLSFVSPAALAYLDPSTGSMVVSAIVGIFASVALALKTYWYRIKGLFKREDKEQVVPRDGAE